MSVVLVAVHKGIISEVKFYDDVSLGLKDLTDRVKSLNLEEDDAAVYDHEGLVINAKALMDKNNQLIVDTVDEIIAVKKTEFIYIIGNPIHSLGFMVIGYNEPIGYKNPIKALVALEKLRKEYGIHIKLYRVESIIGPVMKQNQLEQVNSDEGRTDFEYSLINEYLS